MESPEQRLIKILNFHRTLKGESLEVQNEAIALLKAMGVEFAMRDGQRFVHVQNGVLELLNNGLVSLENLIYQKAINIADANTPDIMTVSKIKGLLGEKVGPMGSVKEMVKRSNSNLFFRVANEMSRLNADGYDSSVIRKAIIGTAKNEYSDGVLGGLIRGSDVMVKTAGVLSNEVAQDSLRRSSKKTIGYVWVSVLDGNTTLGCAALNGKRYYYADSGIHPLPPRHAGCRSSTESIEKGKDVPTVTSISDFIKANPKEAREMLGKNRYKLVTDGRLKIDRFVDRHFESLTLDELRVKNAVAFKRI